MRKATRYFVLFYGLLETFIFTGNIFGWNALHYMLRQEGIYEYLCSDGPSFNESYYYTQVANNGLFTTVTSLAKTSEEQITSYSVSPNISLPTAAPRTCESQDRLLNLAFTIGSFCLGSSAFIWGFLLDKWGLRCVRLMINGLLTVGSVLLSLTQKDTSYLIFPSLILMCLAGVPLRLANMQIADLFPKQRSTIITLYSGAFGASASVFVFIKYGYDAGLPWEWACFLLVALSIVMLPVTLFVLPSRKVEEPTSSKKGLFSSADCTKEVAGIATSVWGTYYLVEELPDGKKRATNCNLHKYYGTSTLSVIEEKQNHQPNFSSACADEQKAPEPPLLRSLLTLSYMMHQYWFCWLLLFTIVFVGTLHLWNERTFENPEEGAFFGELYGLAQVSGLFLAPLGGLFMDWSIAQASKEPDPEVRRLRVLQSNFWPLTVTSLLAVGAQVAKFFDSAEAIVTSIVFVTLFRTFLLSIGTAYLRIRFPADQFGRLLGIMSTMSAVFTLLQFPLFLWETASPRSVLQVNIFDSVCLFVACIHPVLLLITPLQKYFIDKERKQKKKAIT